MVILTGSGAAFCVGGDVHSLPGGAEPGAWTSDNTDDIRRIFKGADRLIFGLQRMEKPVIAIINGVVVGAGFDLACTYDIRIGSPNGPVQGGLY